MPLLCVLRPARASSVAPKSLAFSRLHLAKREMGHPLIRRLATQLAIGAALGWLGPFGTHEMMPLLQRVIYWMISIPVIALFARLAILTVVGHDRARTWPLPLRVAAGALLAGFPATFIVLLLHGLFVGSMRFDAWGLVEIYLTVSIVIGLVAYPRVLLGAAKRLAEAPPEEPEAVVTSPFLRRIPPRLGTELLWLSAEDHYIRVTTSLGSDLILCRLSDAIAELDGETGQRVHRSHWVARRAVGSVERREGKTVLVLVGGETVPVSQSYMPALKAAGWL